MNRTRMTLLPLTTVLCMAPLLAQAQDARVIAPTMIASAECARSASLSSLQVRIVEKSVQGIVPLQQFVWRTRMIYQLDTTETVAWLDQRRATLAACKQRTANIDPAAAAG